MSNWAELMANWFWSLCPTIEHKWIGDSVSGATKHKKSKINIWKALLNEITICFKNNTDYLIKLNSFYYQNHIQLHNCQFTWNITFGERLHTTIRLKRSGLFSKYREIFETICLFVEPINRKMLSFSCTSSKCMRSLNCSMGSIVCFPLKFK